MLYFAPGVAEGAPEENSRRCGPDNVRFAEAKEKFPAARGFDSPHPRVGSETEESLSGER